MANVVSTILIPSSEGRPEPEMRILQEPGSKKTIHTALFHHCHDKVAKEKGDKSAYAICTASIGKRRSMLKYGQTVKDKEGKTG